MAASPILRLRNLTYRYPGGQSALDDVTLDVAEGERVAIVGPSGAGKSTLLLHLNGLLPDSLPRTADANGAAAVLVDGLPISRDRLAEVRRDVGFLFQDPDDQLFCPSVGEDVAFGPLNMQLSREEIDRHIAESLAAVDLAGYENRSTLALSVGERKRVCLAGVLACRPKILALDEPTSNLDPRARRQVMAILDGLDATQIIATHNLDLVVGHCGRVIVLDEGRVRADGPPRTVLADPELMDRHGLEVPLRLLLDGGERDGL
ncbi:MAG: energy-coupling factor ABC transporter ATP-binding protein [Planctomycetaceae bacterium]